VSKSDKTKGSKKNANKAEFQRAMDRLEDAMKDIGEAAKDNFADRAADVLEQTAARLKAEGRGERYVDDEQSLRDSDHYERESREKGSLSHWQGEGSTRPFRDLDNARLWGICAGVAPYLGLEVWVVRCLAVTIFVFAPQIIVPAYLIAYFVLDPRSELDEFGGQAPERATRRQRRRQARQRRAERKLEAKAQRSEAKAQRREAKRSRRSRSARPEPSPNPQTSAVPPARTVLRSVKGTLNEAEQRLRRMESHVTSGRYELQRELHKIESAGS